MMGKTGYFAALGWVGASILLLTVGVSPAQAQGLEDVREFDIEAQALDAALIEFSEQADLQLMVPTELVAGRYSPGVNGSLTSSAALLALLNETELSFEAVGDDTVAVSKADEGGDRDSGNALAPKAVMIAQASTEGGQSNKENTSTAQHADPSEADKKWMEEIVVTGTNIRGVRELAQPSVVITRDDIERTGYVTTVALFESLPQNFNEISSDGVYATGGSSLAGSNRFERATAVNLRGLGAESTLTLVNGKRRAGSVLGRVVDISAIPLSIIERIEVVTGGHSAVYGSDAVAGVVNLTTRRDFTGTESQLSYGGARSGAERLQLSQVAGADFGRGGVVGAYDYQREWKLDLIETGLVVSPILSSGVIPLRSDVRPETWRHSAFLSGHYELSDRIELYADGLYSERKYAAMNESRRPTAAADSFDHVTNVADHFSMAGGARIGLGADWSLDLSGVANTADNAIQIDQFFDFGSFFGESHSTREDHATLYAVSAVMEGPLFSVGSVMPRAAVGSEVRDDRFKFVSNGALRGDDDRRVQSAFLELLVPLVNNGVRPGMRRLELSLAGRYDDYSDFGGTFNPQAGLIWQPADSLTLRAAYSTAFRAPGLHDVTDEADVLIFIRNDPAVPGGTSPVLEIRNGTVPGLGPEEATTWSVGVDYRPEFASDTRFSLSYFEVEYEDRLEIPAPAGDIPLALVNEQNFAGIIDRTPDQFFAQQLIDTSDRFFNQSGVAYDPATQNILDVFPDLVIFDDRLNNIAVEAVRGLDLTFDTRTDTQVGVVNFGFKATYTLKHERSVTTTSPSFSLLNAVGKPVDLRIRAKAAWTRGAYGAFLYLNYTDKYSNPFVTPVGEIDAWTTADLTLRWDGSRELNGRWADGLAATLSFDNLFDADPPEFLNNDEGLRYDASNASPVGRYVSFRLTKRW